MGYCRARLTPFGRKLLVDRILELGWPVAQAAESVGVSRQTAYRWMRRHGGRKEKPDWRIAPAGLTTVPTGSLRRWKSGSFRIGSQRRKAPI